MEHLLSKRVAGHRSSRIREMLRLTEQPGMLSLAGGMPAPATFPTGLLAAAFDRAAAHRGPTGPVAWQYGPTEGLAPLREHVAAAEGVPVDEVLVTTGSQQSLDLLARALCDPGDVIAVEHPTYLGALQAFGLAGATLAGVPGDADGMDTGALADQLRRGLRPKAVYVVADLHNPTGTTLALARRRELVALAARYGFVLIEDDAYGALRFGGDPLPSIASLAPRAEGPDDGATRGAGAAEPVGPADEPEPVGPVERGGRTAAVVRLGTASKILAPGLRVGWMTGPCWLLAAAARTKQAVDLHTSSLAQLVVAEALADTAAFAAHLDLARAHYRAQAAALVDALGRHLPQARVAPPQGGMFAWVDLGLPTGPLLERAVAAGVAFVPGDAFGVPGGDPAPVATRARLSFATLTPAQLDQAVRRLAGAVRSSAGGP